MLIDAGLSYRSLVTAARLFDLDLTKIRAILITHAHSDHIGSRLHVVAQRLDVPVYATAETISGICENADNSVIDFRPVTELREIPFDMAITAFPTPHDKAGSVGFVLETGNCVIGFCTDCGHVTDTMRGALTGANLVYLESNYDPFMLKTGNYPYMLKQRIAGKFGHLSNEDSAGLTAELAAFGTNRFVLAHLSQENNTPEKARNCHLQTLTNAGFKENLDFTLDVAPLFADGKLCVSF